MSRIYELVWIILLPLMIPANGFAQTLPGAANSSGKADAAVISSLKIVQDAAGPAVEIVASRPLKASVQSLDSPPRIVIDLPNAISGIKSRQIPVLQGNILMMRIEPYRKLDPRLKIVVTLLVPHEYSINSEGNRLVIRLKPPEDPYKASQEASRAKSNQQVQIASVSTAAPAPALIPVTSGVGEVLLAGRRFAAGSAVTAGSETAVLQLSRGGEIQVCPGTSLSITPSKNAKDLMVGLSTGAMEAHYALESSADTVLTPDFRIVFSGPGRFDYAISTDSKGNTCVRGLRGNGGPASVSELIGDRSYQVKPSEQAMFHSGRIDKVDTDIPLECGCPPPVPVLRADASPQKIVPDTDSANVTLAQGPSVASSSAASGSAGKGVDADGNTGVHTAQRTLSNGPETQPLSHEQANAVHVQVEAPLVFESKNMLLAHSAPLEAAAALPVIEPARVVTLPANALPPVAGASARRGFMARVRGFFTALFH